MLVERGWNVCAVTHRHAPASTIEGVQWLRANLLDPSDVHRVIGEAQATHLLHLAWYVAPGKWAGAPDNYAWVRAGIDLVSGFKQAGGRRLVGAGTCLEYDWDAGVCSEASTPLRSHTVYGTCKHAMHLIADKMMSGEGLSCLWGRIFFLYGPHEHPDRLVASVIRSLLHGEPARTSHGEQVRDYLSSTDVAGAFVHLLEGEAAGAVNIGSGEPIRLKSIVARIGELMDRSDLIRLGAIPAAPTDKPVVVADVARLSSLGWAPSLTLDAGLRAAIAWWTEQSRDVSKETR
jgi:nucleoside-diphosphate-sugar epimerase